MKFKKHIKTLLKLVLAFGLIYWLKDSGKLDFDILTRFFEHPARPLIGLSLLILNILIATWRWRYLLLQKTSKELPYPDILKHNWIGMFFNSVLPGSVSGDIVKIFYVKKHADDLSQRFLLASIVIDRIIGLFGLILIVGLFSLLSYDDPAFTGSLGRKLQFFNALLVMAMLLSFGALFFFQDLPRKIHHQLERFKKLHHLTSKLADLWEELCKLKLSILKLTLVSAIIHIITVTCFWVVASPFAMGEYSYLKSFTFIPIGFIAITVPLAPSGLGVGHAVFHGLFGLFQIQNGADLFNIFFVLQLAINLVGLIPYLLNKSEINHLEVQQETQNEF